MTRWWHGGPRIQGDLILPASQVGTRSLADYADEARLTGIEDCGDWVYVINVRNGAVLFAAAHPDPWLYEVEPAEPLEPDPDFIDRADSSAQSRRTPTARILRREKPSNADVALARRVLSEQL